MQTRAEGGLQGGGRVTDKIIIIIIINNYGLLDTKVTIFLNATQNIGDIEHGDVPYNNP